MSIEIAGLQTARTDGSKPLSLIGSDGTVESVGTMSDGATISSNVAAPKATSPCLPYIVREGGRSNYFREGLRSSNLLTGEDVLRGLTEPTNYIGSYAWTGDPGDDVFLAQEGINEGLPMTLQAVDSAGNVRDLDAGGSYLAASQGEVEHWGSVHLAGRRIEDVSPDSSSLLVSRSYLYRYDTATGACERFSDMPFVTGASYSPDGSMVVFMRHRSWPDLKKGRNEIWICSSEGSWVAPLTIDEYFEDDPPPGTQPKSYLSPVWSADGASVAFVNEVLEPGRHGTEVTIVEFGDLTTGPPINSVVHAATVGRLGTFVKPLACDGRRVFIVVGGDQTGALEASEEAITPSQTSGDEQTFSLVVVDVSTSGIETTIEGLTSVSRYS